MLQLTAEHATLILHGASLPALKGEHRVTRNVISAIPPDKADYRPDDIAKSAFDLAWHIVSAEHRFMDGVINGAFDFSGAGRPDTIQTPSDIVDWYVGQFATDVERLKELSGEQLVKMIDFRGVIQLPAVTFVQVGTSHSIHHRGQLSTYLRPMGAKVPAIYGESYDSRKN